MIQFCVYNQQIFDKILLKKLIKLFVMIHREQQYSRTHEAKLIEKILADDDDDNNDQLHLQSNNKFQVCVDIGDGRNGIINLDLRSDPYQSAYRFCQQYELNQQIASILAESIQQKIQLENISRGRMESRQKRESRQKILSRSLLNIADNDDKVIRKLRNSMTCNYSKNNSSSNFHSKKTTQSNILAQNDTFECTYKPKINQISKLIIQKSGRRSILQQMELNKRRKQQKVQKLKKEIQNKELAHCSFKPKINPISQKVDNQMNKENTFGCGEKKKRYQELYKKSFVSKKQVRDEPSFKPEINHTSKKYMEGLSFQQRQQKFKPHKTQYIQINPVPKTGRAPSKRNTNNLPIGEYLYEKSKQKKIVKKDCNEPQFNILGKSEDIVQHLKSTRLRQIFEMFDCDGDGKINSENINYELLDQKLLQIFLPILEEMRELQIQLELGQFLEAGERLLSTLPPKDKAYILNTKKKPDQGQSYTFKPQINKKSQELVPKSKDLYIRCLIERQKQKQKADRSKQERVRNQLYQCTFKPKIKKYANLVYFD